MATYTTTIRAFYRLLGVCFWLVPTLVLAAWGGTYVYSCVLALTSSSVPIVLRLKTPGGIVTVRAQSFQYDLHKNYLHATQAVLIAPDGDRLIEIQELHLYDLVPGKKTITGTARGITGKIDRGTDKKWKFLDYLPKQTDGEASGIAFSLKLEDVSVKITDMASKKPFTRWVATTGVNIDGVGDDLVITGPIRLEGTGTTDLAFRKKKDGLYVSGKGQMELAPIIDWIKDSPEARDLPWINDFKVRRLTADGPWEITYVKEKFALRVPGRATFAGLSYGEYSADSGEVQGTLTETGFDGYATANAEGSKGRFEGRVRWEDGVEMAGRVEGSAPSVAALPKVIRSAMPTGTAFTNANAAGWLTFRKEVSFLGSVEAAAVRYEGEEFRDVRAKIDVTPAMATVGISQANYLGQPVTGAIQIVPNSQKLDGFVTAKRVILEPILKRFGFEGVRGQGEVTATLTGTTKAPMVQFVANGQAKSTLSGSLLDLGDFSVRGTYNNDRVTLERSGIKGPSGSAYASGLIDLKNNKLNLDVLASDFPLEAITKEVSGAATFRGAVRGALNSPVAMGGAEVYNLRVAEQEIPVGFADIIANAEGLTAKNLVAIRGGSRVQGEAGIRWKDKSLYGGLAAYGIQAKDWFPDQIAGIVDVTGAKIGGTLSAPTLTAEVTGSNLVVPGLKLDSIRGAIQYADGRLRIRDGEAKVGEGILAATGELNLETRSGTFALDVKELPLGRLLFDAAKTFNISGTASMKGEVVLGNGELTSVTTSGLMRDVALNETVLGSGDLNANYAGGVWSGNALIGQLDSFFEVPRFSLNPATEQLDAEFILNNEPLSKLTSLAKRYGGDAIPEKLAQTLDRLEGEVDFNGTTSGKWTNPILESKTFSLSGIKIDGVYAGDVSSEFSRVDGLWTIAGLTWTGPELSATGENVVSPSMSRAATLASVLAPAVPLLGAFSLVPIDSVMTDAQNARIQAKFEAKGTVDEHGETHVTGSLTNLLARSLSIFTPGIAGLDGVFNMPYFEIEGPTKSPTIEASLGYRDTLIATEGKSRSIDLTTTIQEGMIDAVGLYQLNGFTGPIEAKIPFQYPFTIAETGDIVAKITLPERKLVDLQELWPTLDPSRTAGSIQGEINVTGKPDALKFTGAARLLPEEGKGVQLADTSLGTYLKDLDATVLFDGQKLSINAKGNSSDTGSFAVRDVGVGLGDVFAAMVSGNVDGFYNNALMGRVDLDRFKVAYNDKSSGPITGTLSGGIDLKGNVRQPLIEGDLIIDEGNFAVPTLEGTGASGEFTINPMFNLNINTAQPIRFRAGAGQFDLTGTAAIKGSLETPDMAATLVTRRGSIRLPNARIAIEEGGTIRITYRTTPSGIVASRADLEMQGTTQVTAEKFGGGGVERYDVFLDIRGNILEDQGLLLTARSDPPDLSQDRILALLGQGDFLRSISINALSPTEQLRSALVGLALPYLAGSITDKIASSLGLDYINVEYSSFDRVTVTAAISLTRDLVLSGRRQISNPQPGERPKYDIRLSYRPRFAGRSLSRLSFSVGFDQDRPWKIGVEYGIKF